MPASDLTLVTVDARILSSYNSKPLVLVGNAGRAPQDVADALLALCTELPLLRVTELFRLTATQAAARKKYENWLAAGKPAARSATFDSKTMKNAYVAVPGKSMHNAGRAIDVDISTLQKIFGKEYLDAFWPVAAKHGFTPIIAKPEEGKSESWHFDHRGSWDAVGDHYGYEAMAMCAALVTGQAGEWQSDSRLMQALLLRAGFDIGEPDGVVGKRTLKALTLALGEKYQSTYPTVAKILEGLRKLSATATWTKVVA